MYRAPVDTIAFTLKHSAGFAAAQAEGIYDDLGDDLLEAVLSEAGKFAGDVIAPLNRIGEIADVVRAVLYLEDADFVTGEISYVDGGRTAGH